MSRRVAKIKKDFLKYIPLFIIALLVFIVFFFNYEVDCKDDQYCFMRAAKKCDSAVLSINKDENTFTYKIVSGDKDSCIVGVTASMVNGDAINKDLFEGKKMLCDVPKEELSQYFISELPGLIDYCTGELKEAMYEFIINRMYGVIAQNLGDIISELKTDI